MSASAGTWQGSVKNILRTKLQKLIDAGELTEAQAHSVAFCVEVEYETCPEDMAECLLPLMLDE